MAPRMKHWAGLTALGMAAVTMALMPPSGPEWTNWPVTLERSHEEARAAALRSELAGLHLLLQGRRWSDSLSALALATERDGMAVGGPEGVPAEDLEAVRRAAGNELAGTVRDDVVLGFYVQPRDFQRQGAPRRVVKTSRSTVTASISEKPAPMHRRTPPPKGIQVLGAGLASTKRSGRNASGSR